MRLIIYGLGREALYVKDMVKSPQYIVGFTDSFAEIEMFGGYKYYNLNELERLQYDYIIITLNQRKLSDEIKEMLVTNYHIKRECIINFFEMYAEQKVDKVMSTCKQKCDGIILGISHAALGLNPQYMGGGYCVNLANGSEDIFYHYQVIKKCAEKYGAKIENIKYAIIDMYDYTIFNYDASLSNQILFYWSHGGMMENLHNFHKNKNFLNSPINVMKEYGYFSLTTESLRKLRSKMFDEKLVKETLQNMYSNKEPVYLGFNDYPLEVQFCNGLPQEPFLPFDLHYMGEPRYPKTIEENIYLLEQTVKLLRGINSNIKIYFLLMPRYFILEQYHKILLQSYKSDFENIVGKFEKEFGIVYLNMKDTKTISKNPHFYRDTAHLNYYGAIAFTGILEKTIFDKSSERRFE